MAKNINYVSPEKLGYYDEKSKAWVKAQDAAVKSELQAQIDAANKKIEDENTRAVAAELTNARAAQAAQTAAEGAQTDVNNLKTYVGTLPTGATATDVVGYINEKTANIASDAALGELAERVSNAETDIANIEKDYLKEADKTELKNQITAVDTKADAAQSHSEGVAESLAKAETALKAADTAQVTRIENIEEKITGLTGAMHFKGTETALPKDVSNYAEGDVIIVGEKEYVFNGTEFKEFGDVSAEGQRIATLEGKMETAESDIAQAKKDIVANADAVAKKVELTAFNEKVTALEGADSALDTRVKTLEDIDHDAYKTADTTLKAELNEVIVTKADASTVTAMDAAYKAADTALDGRITALESTTYTEVTTEYIDGLFA